MLMKTHLESVSSNNLSISHSHQLLVLIAKLQLHTLLTDHSRETHKCKTTNTVVTNLIFRTSKTTIMLRRHRTLSQDRINLPHLTRCKVVASRTNTNPDILRTTTPAIIKTREAPTITSHIRASSLSQCSSQSRYSMRHSLSLTTLALISGAPSLCSQCSLVAA
jgi:hypothetical protein